MKHVKIRRPRRSFGNLKLKQHKELLEIIDKPFSYLELAPLLSEHGKEMVLKWYYRGNIKQWWMTQESYGNELNFKA